MATIRDNAIARVRNIFAELAAIDATKAGGVPNTKSQDGGTTVDHVEYRLSLWKEVDYYMEFFGARSLAELESIIDGDDGPFEITTEVSV